MTKNRYILLDRDGVINYDSPYYIKSEEEFSLIPEHINALVRLTKAGYKIGVASNQSGVSRGLYSEDTLKAINKKMIDLLAKAGAKIDAVEYCIHLPEQFCLCRKPKPGMLYNLVQKLGCSINGVHFVGDRMTDIQAAKAAGAKPVIILSSMTTQESLQDYPDVPIYESLATFVTEFLDD